MSENPDKKPRPRLHKMRKKAKGFTTRIVWFLLGGACCWIAGLTSGAERVGQTIPVEGETVSLSVVIPWPYPSTVHLQTWRPETPLEGYPLDALCEGGL